MILVFNYISCQLGLWLFPIIFMVADGVVPFSLLKIPIEEKGNTYFLFTLLYKDRRGTSKP